MTYSFNYERYLIYIYEDLVLFFDSEEFILFTTSMFLEDLKISYIAYLDCIDINKHQ